MAIFITGDTHGDFSRLLPAAFHEQRDLTKEDYLIICGDFGGVWDGGDAEQQWLDWLETRSFTTLFVSGNHENYDLLRNYPIRPMARRLGTGHTPQRPASDAGPAL